MVQAGGNKDEDHIDNKDINHKDASKKKEEHHHKDIIDQKGINRLYQQ